MMMKRSRREDKEKERSFLSEDKGDKEDRERIVKEECHLNKEVASSVCPHKMVRFADRNCRQQF